MTIFQENPELYLKRRIIIVPIKDSNRVFYCREFAYAPMWVHYLDKEYDQFFHAQIPYHVRAKLFIPDLYLALIVPGRKLFLFDRDMKPVQVYNSYSHPCGSDEDTGLLSFSSLSFDEPKGLEDVIKILDLAEEALKTIHQDEVIYEAPRGLVPFDEIIKAVKER